MEFQVICSWCGKGMGTKGKPCPSDEPRITHSICPECAGRVRAEIKAIPIQGSKKPDNQ